MKVATQKKNERGAITVEIIAVIALLGVMGPLLFKQVNSRNEEIENINIASEMRTIKEGLTAYILSDKSNLMSRLTEDGVCLADSDVHEAVYNYLPEGNNALDDYEVIVCRFRNLLQGFVIPTENAMPERVRLKRAARIANLIGADGAICQDGMVNGVAAGWSLSREDTEDFGLCAGASSDQVAYLASTGMDTYIPEVAFEDYSASLVSLPEKLGLQDLHAWRYFSVGSGSQNCFDLKHNETGNYSAESGYTAMNDEIKDAGDNGCNPLFWVGSISSANHEAGDVYVKNNLMIGQQPSGDRAAIGLFKNAETAVDDDSYDETRAAGNRIEVYDNTGVARVIINGKGEIIAQGPEGSDANAETLTLTHQGLESGIEPQHVSGEYFRVDPAYTSVMNDIRLDSRGGARLSEILPNYISKGVYAVQNGSTVPEPACPRLYAPALIVLPSGFEEKGEVSLQKIADGLQASGTAIQLKAGADSTVQSENGGLIIRISGGTDSDGLIKGDEMSEDKSVGTGNWTIAFTDAGGAARNDVKGIAQTYCVYDTDYQNGWSDDKQPTRLTR